MRDVTRTCVAETDRHLYRGKRCCCGLAACLSFARMHAHTHTQTHVCGISREVMVSACIHTQVCCRNEESVVTLPVALILSDCARMQPPGVFRRQESVDMHGYVVVTQARLLRTGCYCDCASVVLSTRVCVWPKGRSRNLVIKDVVYTHVCFTSTESVVTVRVCGVCKWCLVTQTEVLQTVLL